ncbi:unnamed protein product [Cunninghamella echinulata]
MSDNRIVNATTSSSSTTNGAEHKLKKFFEDKDWKFYLAVLAGVGVVGASAYYLSQPSSPKEKPSKKEGNTSIINATREETTRSTTSTTTTTTTSTTTSK